MFLQCLPTHHVSIKQQFARFCQLHAWVWVHDGFLHPELGRANFKWLCVKHYSAETTPRPLFQSLNLLLFRLPWTGKYFPETQKQHADQVTPCKLKGSYVGALACIVVSHRLANYLSEKCRHLMTPCSLLVCNHPLCVRHNSAHTKRTPAPPSESPPAFRVNLNCHAKRNIRLSVTNSGRRARACSRDFKPGC